MRNVSEEEVRAAMELIGGFVSRMMESVGTEGVISRVYSERVFVEMTDGTVSAWNPSLLERVAVEDNSQVINQLP